VVFWAFADLGLWALTKPSSRRGTADPGGVAEPHPMERLSARLTRQSGTNFYYAFRLLSERKRQALYAVYAFCRVVDDCVDEEGGGGEAGLEGWLEEVRRCYRGQPTTELGRDLAPALAEFPIPESCFEDVVAGCRMDLTIKRYRTFPELEVYCHRVASAVGLACIEIFGYKNPKTKEYAGQLGLALQLTNILRDVGTDATRGRLYVPLEDLERFRVEEAQLLGGSGRTRELGDLLSYEGERARDYYRRARALLPPEDRRSMLSAEIMRAIYQEILDALARRGYPLGPRLRLSPRKKAWLALRTLVEVYAA
jgi:15-cis-phytoene synthase